MKKVLFIGCLLIGNLALASEYLSQDMSPLSADVIVPVVDSAADVNIQAGLMFYDIGSGLKVINNLGAVEDVTVADAVTSGSIGERVERVAFGNGALSSGPTSCTSSPCTILSQSGSWISSVEWTSTGHYTLHIANSTFSSAPQCSCNAMNDASMVGVFTSTTTAVTIGIRNSGSYVDAAINCQCMGPK